MGISTEPASSRERIVHAARRLFAERGYGATSMVAIADEAGVVRATVYNNFSDKIDILETLIQRYMKGYVAIGDELRRTVASYRTTFDLLEAMTRMALEWRIANRDLRGVIDIARHTPGSGWERANAEADEALLSWIRQIHDEGHARGLTRSDLDLDVATPAVYSMIEMAVSSFDVSAPRSRLVLLAHQLTLLHWYAIYASAPAEFAVAGTTPFI